MKKSTYTTPVSKSDDPDMQGVMPALLRARKRAHKIAHDTNTNIVIMRDGKVVEIPPDPELYNDVPDLDLGVFFGGDWKGAVEGSK